jgi:hypothetical protein
MLYNMNKIKSFKKKCKLQSLLIGLSVRSSFPLCIQVRAVTLLWLVDRSVRRGC